MGRKVYALWWGGGNYAVPYLENDLEAFDSIREARDAFESRRRYDLRYPCVGADSAMWLYFADPREREDGNGDAYPDRLLEFGPRGGVRMQPC